MHFFDVAAGIACGLMCCQCSSHKVVRVYTHHAAADHLYIPLRYFSTSMAVCWHTIHLEETGIHMIHTIACCYLTWLLVHAVQSTQSCSSSMELVQQMGYPRYMGNECCPSGSTLHMHVLLNLGCGCHACVQQTQKDNSWLSGLRNCGWAVLEQELPMATS